MNAHDRNYGGGVFDGRGGHTHAASAGADKRYLAVVLGLLIGFLVTEVVVAIGAGSLVLLSDAGHMLSDVAAIAAALWAMRLAACPPSGQWTFGWKRAEILSAAGNGITLVVISGIVTVEAIRRLLTPPDVAGIPVVVVAGIGVGVNVAASLVLAKADRTSLNVRGEVQHILTDLYGFLATIAAGIIILTTGWTRADPIASLLVVVLMLHAAWRLLRDSGRILLEAAPEHLDLVEVRAHLLGVEHVRDLHDLHLWTVTSNLPAIAAHVVVEDACITNGHAPQLLDQIQHCLAGHFDVEHSTFQLEPTRHTDHEPDPHA